MTRAHGRRRLLRGGRVLARLVFVWVLVAVALAVLDRMLVDFAMPYWWQPTVFALMFGLLSAVVWPLVLRFALPLAMFTLGIGSLLLLGAGILAISFAVPGVVIANLRTAVVVVIVMTAVGAGVSSLLALDEDELFFRRAARRFRRVEGADGEETPPGVLLLQIDGLGYDTVRRAVRDGDLPTLARWLADGSHVLTDWHCDWSSQTGASVCGLLHGDNDDILGFRWYEKDRDHVMACAHPADAAEIERRHSDGRGLLSGGGAARSGLFTGDAEHTSMTMSAVPLLTPSRKHNGTNAGGATDTGYYAYFANPVNLFRTIGSAVVDILREVSASVRQRRAGVRPRVKRGGFYPFARSATTVITRDLVVSAIIGDMLAGRPVVYADFLGYDEVAHHTGIERFDALAVIRAIDQQIGRLHRATQLAPRRYELIVLSDHGVTQGWAFTDRFGESIEALVGRLCGAPPKKAKPAKPAPGWQLGAALAEASAGGGPIARSLRARAAGVKADRHRTLEGTPGAVARAAPGVVVVVSGHVAMVSFTEHPGRVDLETIEREFPDLLPALVDHPGVGFILVRGASGPLALGRDGVRRLATDTVTGTDPLVGYGPHAADLIRRTDGFEHCPDLLINSNYTESTDDASPFEPHVGSHGGLGGGQSRGFLVHPADLPPAGEILGAEALHRVVRGWLTHLGHPVPSAGPEVGDPQTVLGAQARGHE